MKASIAICDCGNAGLREICPSVSRLISSRYRLYDSGFRRAAVSPRRINTHPREILKSTPFTLPSLMDGVNIVLIWLEIRFVD